MSKRKGKNKKSDPSPDFRLKRRAHGKVTKVKKSRAAVHQRRILDAHRNAIKVLAAILALVLLAIVVSHLGPPPDYDACLAPSDTTTPTQQSFHFNVFVQVGNATGLATQFIKIDAKMGTLAGCTYPMHAGYRGLEYVAIEVRSPYTQSQHAYTLGDFFSVWGRWTHDQNTSLPAKGFAFSPTRVLSYQGAVQVRISATSAGTNYTLNREYGALVVQPNLFYHVWVRDPIVDLGTDY